jgi:hypothetical protein
LLILLVLEKTLIKKFDHFSDHICKFVRTNLARATSLLILLVSLNRSYTSNKFVDFVGSGENSDQEVLVFMSNIIKDNQIYC